MKSSSVIFLFFFVCGGFTSLPVHAQQNSSANIDSLLTELVNSKEDSSKIYLFIKAARAISEAGEYDRSLDYCLKAIALAKKLHVKHGEASALNAIAVVFFRKGNMTEALKKHLAALKIGEEINDQKIISICYNGIGNINLLNQNFPEALKYHTSALEINLKYGFKSQLHHSYNNIGNIHSAMGNFKDALPNYYAALEIRKELGLRSQVADIYNNIGVIYDQQKDHLLALKNYEASLKIQEELGDKQGISTSYNNLGSVYTSLKKFDKAKKYAYKSLALSKELGNLESIKFVYATLTELDSASGNHASALERYKMFVIMRDSIQNVDNARTQVQIQMQYEFDKKAALAKVEQDKKDVIAAAEIQKQKIVRNGFVGGFAVVLIFSGVVFTQRNKIRKGKKRSDELLLNILPAETAEELKMKGSADARSYDEVTVMFTDLKNFTQVSSQLSAVDLVKEINHIYSNFDLIVEKYNLEKIKTIGDSYMCAGGLPVTNITHASDSVQAAMEMQLFFSNYLQGGSLLANHGIGLRIGIHTGPVVAGIVGIRKFAYDIWGDTVNVASRMESSGEAGKVNISGTAYEHVKNTVECVYRGKIEAKNKGMIDMYFVTG